MHRAFGSVRKTQARKEEGSGIWQSGKEGGAMPKGRGGLIDLQGNEEEVVVKKKKKKLAHSLFHFFSFLSFSPERRIPVSPRSPPPLSPALMPPICFSAVYRGRDALATYAASPAAGSSSSASAASAVNNFRAVAASCLERCPPGGEAK